MIRRIPKWNVHSWADAVQRGGGGGGRDGGERIERAKWESLLEAEMATGEIKVSQTVELVGWKKSLSKKDEHERKDGREEVK